MPFTTPQLPQPKSGSKRTATRENSVSNDLARLLYGTSRVPSSENAPVPEGTIGRVHLSELLDDWLRASERAGNSPRTLEVKSAIAHRFIQFAELRGFSFIGSSQLNAYFDHLAHGHEELNGRFGIGERDKRAFQPMRPVTRQTHRAYLQSFWNWMQKNGHLSGDTFQNIEHIRAQSDQITPFSDGQIHALLHVAKQSSCPLRNVALILFLLDTGVRASELCGIRLGDVDFSDGAILRVRVFGKGQKFRTLRLGPETSEAMWKYFKTEHGLERFYKRRATQNRIELDASTPLFISAHHARLGYPLTRDGLRILIGDLGTSARIGAVRCSPHTFRHTFAISFLRSGGNLFALKEMLGHSSLKIVERYLKIAQADIETQHARHSPTSNLLRKR